MPREIKNYESVTEALLEALVNSKLSYKRLEKETGVVRQSLMKFTSGETSLRLDIADKLVKYFDIRISRKAK